MSEKLESDICIIGGGSGGLVVAAVAAQLGVPTVLVEKDKMGGGLPEYGLCAVESPAGGRPCGLGGAFWREF